MAFGAMRAVARIAQFLDVLGTDGQGDLDPLTEESALDLGFEGQTRAVRVAHDARDRAGVTVLAPPRDVVIGIRIKKAALFAVLTTMVVAEEEAAINRWRHCVLA